ncbi:hypothetical protein Hanom_Chr16g01425921 [Helianthus anomalus]
MKKLLFYSFSLILYSDCAFTQSVKLDTQEVKVLKEIEEKLGMAGKKIWNFDKDPCSGNWGWERFIFCDCSFESNTTCHVIQLYVFRSCLGNLLAKPELGKLKSFS